MARIDSPEFPEFRPDQLLSAKHDTTDLTGPLLEFEVID